MIKNKLYNGEVEILFDHFKHRYTYDGKEVISVTKALSVINKPALVNWAANSAIDSVCTQVEPGKSYDELQLQAIWDSGRRAHFQKKVDAGNLGTFLHKWIESYIKGDVQGMPVNEGLKESVNKFLAWVEKYNVKFVLSEQCIYSKKYNYVGTTDFICTINGDLYIGDTKTSSGIYPEMLIQTSAYRYARHEEFPNENYTGQLIIRIGKDGTFEYAVVRKETAYKQMFKGFLSAVELSRTLTSLQDFRPEKE